ncbi:hypothetical protein TKK_0010832 [Trichogramma kaykai]
MGDIFLLRDSFEDDDFTFTCGRIIIFTTRENLKVLFRSPLWKSDFELAIINAAAEFGGTVRLCLFHLCQSVYRFLCEVGLQSAYKDSKNDSVRTALRMMCALAFVPVDDVEKVFDLFKEQEELPEVFRIKVVPYFERTYVRRKKSQKQSEGSGSPLRTSTMKSLGQAVRKKPDGHFVTVKDRIINIVMRSDEYVEDDSQLKYIKDLGHYLHL